MRLLSEVMGPSTVALLDRVGVPQGSFCLDLGCGGGDVSFELARRTGPGGRVLGVDLDATKIELARREAAELQLSNLTFEVQDVDRWIPHESFDIVYARFLLSHLPDPESLLAILRKKTRGSGAIVIEDVDFRGHFAEPDCPALRCYVEWYSHSVQSRDADPNIGPRLPTLLRDAGFESVEFEMFQPVDRVGGIKLLTCVTLENIAPAVAEEGLATDDEICQALHELYEFARDPQTLLGGPRVFQVWARS